MDSRFTEGNHGALPRLRGRGEQGHIVSPVLCRSTLCTTTDFEDLDHYRILPVRCLRILARASNRKAIEHSTGEGVR
jgi:hypothetical protein